MKIIRPLLDETKKDLEEYNKINNVPYSIDVSNLSDDYRRNKIRHTVIEYLSESERKTYLDNIKKDNEELEKIVEQSKNLVHGNHLLCEEIKNVNQILFAYALFILLNKVNIFSISKRRIANFYSMLDSNKANIKVKLNGEVNYYQEYGKIYVLKNPKIYRYVLDTNEHYSFDEFEVNLHNLNAKKEDYPLLIRPFEKGDKYLIKNNLCSVRRLFIDWKMPVHLRKIWPLIVNRFGKVIYIPRYRENFVQKETSVFKIHFNEDNQSQ